MTKSNKVRNWMIFLGTIVGGIIIGFLISEVSSRKTEAKFAYQPQVDIPANEAKSEVWGANYPREYQSWKATSDTSVRTLYNGSAMIDMLEVDPRLVVLWAGYGFAKDYNQGRGHMYAVEDLRNSLRTGAPMEKGEGPMVGTCWTCKSPDIARLIAEHGPDYVYEGKWSDKGDQIVNPIGCLDCHDPETMELTITRPALVEGLASMGMNIEDASHQEMRSLVCAQCHVEYYFNKKKPGSEGVPYLTFPWKNGWSVEDMEKYYDEIEFSDWTHTISKAPMLKAQHPGYEVFKTGVHAKRGVSCADCHMPYKSEGGAKYTDHSITSPLKNPANSCQVCHRIETDKLISDVYERQTKILENRDQLERLLVRAHVEAGKAWELGATEADMKEILQDIRHAQWRWDYAAASHGGSFHSPVEVSRVIATGIDIAQEGRIKLARLFSTLGFNEEVPYPDISSKAKAQAFIGLNAPKLEAEKKEFIKKVVPKWLETAKQNNLLAESED